MAADDHTPVERLLARKSEHDETYAQKISQRAAQSQRTLEGYLQAGNRPRWMERLGEIEAGVAQARRRLERAYHALQSEHAGDPEGFTLRWHEIATTWSFDDVNLLIEQHNEWFPIERQLPVNPRTRDYVLVNGKPYRREPLTPDWILTHFPPRLP